MDGLSASVEDKRRSHMESTLLGAKRSRRKKCAGARSSSCVYNADAPRVKHWVDNIATVCMCRICSARMTKKPEESADVGRLVQSNVRMPQSAIDEYEKLADEENRKAGWKRVTKSDLMRDDLLAALERRRAERVVAVAAGGHGRVEKKRR